MGERWDRWMRGGCTTCDLHADAPILSWRGGTHRTWCPTYGRTLLGYFFGLLSAPAVLAPSAPKMGRYFDWRLFAFMLDLIVVMLCFHVRARRVRS